jgi:hypothetical protein
MMDRRRPRRRQRPGERLTISVEHVPEVVDIKTLKGRKWVE